MKKQAKDINRHFPKEDLCLANKHTQRFSSSLVNREMQTRTTIRHDYIPVRRAQKTKKAHDTKSWGACEANGTCIYC